jgi:hypothetical protein
VVKRRGETCNTEGSSDCCRQEDERRENDMEYRGSTRQELHEEVLVVVSLDGSMAQPRCQVEDRTETIRRARWTGSDRSTQREATTSGLACTCRVPLARVACTHLASEDGTARDWHDDCHTAAESR